MKKLRRMNEHAMLGGVCSGLAYYFGLETWLVRLLYVFLVGALGTGVIFYILLWAFVPRYETDPEDYVKLN
jgi:phage shock protein PspC (stress-responsive transcriptional regulator)